MARRMDRLVPWLLHARTVIKIPCRAPPDIVEHALATGVVWMHWATLPAPNKAPAPELLSVYEALELLELLARIDYDEWLPLVTQTWPSGAKFWARAFSPSPFRLGVKIDVKQRGQLSKWAERAFSVDTALSSSGEDYAHVRGEMEAALPGKIDVLEPVVKICVRVVLYEPSRNENESLSLLLLEAVRLLRIRARQVAMEPYSRGWKPLFRLAQVELDSVVTDLSLADLLCIEDITSCGVRVPALPLCAMNEMVRWYPECIITYLQRVIVVPGKYGRVPVESVEINFYATRRTLDSVFSSLHHSTTVRQICVDMTTDVDEDNQDRLDRLLYWIALCVFGRSRCPALESVRLDISTLQQRDIQTLERTLQEVNIISTIFGEVTTADDNAYTVKNASKFLLHRPPDSVDPSQVLLLRVDVPLKTLRVIGIDGEWVSVLLPGWGQAWVCRSDVTLERLSPTEDAALAKASQPVRLLIIEDAQEPILLELLRVVGPGLEELCVFGGDGALSKRGVRAMCLACPDLKQLTIEDVGIELLDSLARCYADGSCHASQLLLSVVHEPVNGTSPFEFFRWLTEETHYVSQYLRELELQIRTSRLSDQLQQLISSAAEMLARNRSLWNLEITIHLPSEETRLSARNFLALYGDVFFSQDNPCVVVRTAPLGMEKKLAFLSALRGTHDQAQVDIDTNVVGHIFQYAAECKTRRVLVTVE